MVAPYKKTVHFMIRIPKKREEEGAGSHCRFQGHIPYDLKLPARPHFLKVPTPPNSTKLGTTPLIHMLLWNIPDLNYIVERDVNLASKITRTNYPENTNFRM